MLNFVYRVATKRYFLFPSKFLWIKVFISLWEISVFAPTVNMSSYCVSHLIGFVKEKICMWNSVLPDTQQILAVHILCYHKELLFLAVSPAEKAFEREFCFQ